VCQEVAGVSIAVGNLKNSTGQIQDEQTQQALSKIEAEARRIFEGIRGLSHDLHPATLQLVGLPSALQADCVEVEKRSGVPVTFSLSGDIGELHPDVAVSFFRIAQESARNAIEHGQPSQLSVALARWGDQLELTVTDDGRGFETVHRVESGLGLVSIEERAHVVGAEVQIVTGLGRGTTVRVRGPAKGGDVSAKPSLSKDVQ
jgi:signal transduction histidine kinase